MFEKLIRSVVAIFCIELIMYALLNVQGMGLMESSKNQALPMMRMYELQVVPEEQDAYNQVGYYNMGKSVDTEKGTFAMYSAYSRVEPNLNYVFEVYQDESAYKRHIQSEQFGAFVKVAKTAVSNRSIVDLKSFYLQEGIALHQMNPTMSERVYIHTITVKSQDEAIMAVKAYGANFVDIGKGRLAIYIGQKQSNPNQFIVWEVYRSESSQVDFMTSKVRGDSYKQLGKYIIREETVALQSNILVTKGSF